MFASVPLYFWVFTAVCIVLPFIRLKPTHFRITFNVLLILIALWAGALTFSGPVLSVFSTNAAVLSPFGLMFLRIVLFVFLLTGLLSLCINHTEHRVKNPDRFFSFIVLGLLLISISSHVGAWVAGLELMFIGFFLAVWSQRRKSIFPGTTFFLICLQSAIALVILSWFLIGAGVRGDLASMSPYCFLLAPDWRLMISMIIVFATVLATGGLISFGALKMNRRFGGFEVGMLSGVISLLPSVLLVRFMMEAQFVFPYLASFLLFVVAFGALAFRLILIIDESDLKTFNVALGPVAQPLCLGLVAGFFMSVSGSHVNEAQQTFRVLARLYLILAVVPVLLAGLQLCLYSNEGLKGFRALCGLYYRSKAMTLALVCVGLSFAYLPPVITSWPITFSLTASPVLGLGVKALLMKGVIITLLATTCLALTLAWIRFVFPAFIRTHQTSLTAPSARIEKIAAFLALIGFAASTVYLLPVQGDGLAELHWFFTPSAAFNLSVNWIQLLVLLVVSILVVVLGKVMKKKVATCPPELVLVKVNPDRLFMVFPLVPRPDTEPQFASLSRLVERKFDSLRWATRWVLKFKISKKGDLKE